MKGAVRFPSPSMPTRRRGALPSEAATGTRSATPSTAPSSSPESPTRPASSRSGCWRTRTAGTRSLSLARSPARRRISGSAPASSIPITGIPRSSRPPWRRSISSATAAPSSVSAAGRRSGTASPWGWKPASRPAVSSRRSASCVSGGRPRCGPPPRTTLPSCPCRAGSASSGRCRIICRSTSPRSARSRCASPGSMPTVSSSTTSPRCSSCATPSVMCDGMRRRQGATRPASSSPPGRRSRSRTTRRRSTSGARRPLP